MKKRALVLILCMLIMIIAGCQTAAKKPLTPDNMSYDTTNTSRLTETQKQSMTNRLSNVAESVQGVRQATVIVTDTASAMTPGSMDQGNTGNNGGINNTRNYTTGVSNQNPEVMVMVGLTVNSGVMQNTRNLNQIQRTVANRIKASDRRVDQVLVTTNSDLVSRMNNIATSISNGKPVQRDVTDLQQQMTNQPPTF